MRPNRRDRWRALTRRLAVIALLGSALAGCGGAGDGPVPTEGSRAVRTIHSLSARREASRSAIGSSHRWPTASTPR
jgi:hypothetical protein